MFERTYENTVREILSKTDSEEDKAKAILLSAIDGLLTETPEGNDRPYAMLPEVTSHSWDLSHHYSDDLYVTCATNIGALAALVGDSEYRDSDKTSRLHIIFENLRKYEAKVQGCSKEGIRKPAGLAAWDIFCIIPRTKQRMAAFSLCADIYLRYPNASYEAAVDEAPIDLTELSDQIDKVNNIVAGIKKRNMGKKE